MKKNHVYTIDECRNGYWQACADYEMTRTETPLDWRLQGMAADTVALWHDRWVAASERAHRDVNDRYTRKVAAIGAVCSETGDDPSYFVARVRR